MTLDENLRIFMQDYHRVLHTEKFEGLAEFLNFPFEIAIKGATVRLNTLEEAVAAFEGMTRVNARRGVQHVDRRVLALHATSLSEALLATDETAYDSTGRKLVSWQSSYLLKRVNGLWRLTKANAIGHDKAWEAKGMITLQAASESSLC